MYTDLRMFELAKVNANESLNIEPLYSPATLYLRRPLKKRCIFETIVCVSRRDLPGGLPGLCWDLSNNCRLLILLAENVKPFDS